MNDRHSAADTTDTLVVLDGVTYRYPKARQLTLRKVDLKVRPGRYLLISGASGSGKSTLVRTFNGLIPHFYGGHLEGDIVIGGRSVYDCTVADCFHQVAMVAQNPQAQLFNRNVARELAFGLESLGLPRRRMEARIAVVAADMGIAELLDRNPQALSGGEQQLVAIAAVLVARPHIMVLDEPLANLDGAHVSRLRSILTRLMNEGMGVVVCEHRMGATLPDADEVVVLGDGKIMIQGPTSNTLSLPDWQAGSVDLPLAVRIGMELKLDPIPRSIGEVPIEAVSTWVGNHPPEPSQSNHHGAAAVLRTENITWTCNGRDILKGIDMDLYAGQCAALVGANGAGKTSLLRVVNGLIRPTTGHIWIKGRETTASPAWQVGRHIGTAFQNPDSQFFKLTVSEELAVGPKAQGCYDSHWIDMLIDLFDLGHLIDRAPFKLSGGEKKRVAFAAALAAKPSILVLDEPTAGQDGRFGRALIKGLKQLCSNGTAILIVTHALGFAEAVASQWMVMAEGSIIGKGTPHGIMGDQTLMQTAGLEPTERHILWQRANQIP